MWKTGGSGRTDAFKNLRRCSKCNKTTKYNELEMFDEHCFTCWLQTPKGQLWQDSQRNQAK